MCSTAVFSFSLGWPFLFLQIITLLMLVLVSRKMISNFPSKCPRYFCKCMYIINVQKGYRRNNSTNYCHAARYNAQIQNSDEFIKLFMTVHGYGRSKKLTQTFQTSLSFMSVPTRCISLLGMYILLMFVCILNSE